VTLHADALGVLTAWQSPDAEQERLRQRYADHLAAHPDGLWRSCLPDHVTVGALVVSADRSRVLLNLHGKARRWFHFGGHCEPDDETLAGVALREVLEQSDLASVRLSAEPVQLSEHAVPFCSPGSDVHHLDVRYAAIADDSDHAVSDESLDVRWWPVDALPELEPEMLELIELSR
jgi:8-oxo-dGTP pyrophosphatase MutT (NUDIX family)